MPRRRHARQQSEKKRIVRKFKQLRKTGRLNTLTRELYTDNRGVEYDSKWVAKVSSLVNFIMSCFKNGFPIIVKKLWYPAWAFYPFFFIGPKAWDSNSVYSLNHERIHIRQQRELLILCLPIFIGIGVIWSFKIFVIYLFIPTIFYMLDIIYTTLILKLQGKKIRVPVVRARTSFEMEATINSSDLDYLLKRKPFSFFKYLLRPKI